MSIYEASITNPKKQLEFYRDLSEQLQKENQKYKEVIDKIQKEINDEYSIMGVKVVENHILLDILKEVE